MAVALINYSALLLSQSKRASSICSSSKSGENIPIRWHHLQLPLHRNKGSCCTTEVHLSRKAPHRIVSCLPSSSSSSTSSHSSPATRFNPSTRLFVSGLSFRTTEESLKNAFKNFGSLVEVNLVMDKIANRPRGFAFLRYANEEQCKQAIEGMHGKFLDGRVIFVEYAKPRSHLRSKEISGP